MEEPLFDADFLDRLRTLFFKLRRRRQLQKQGMQNTVAAGFTREFKDHRQYTPGDDYRTIDWRLFARLDREYIRIYEEIQEFHVHVVLDRSNSMAEPFPEKRVLSLRLAVALAYLAMVTQHRVSVMTIGENLRRETQPLKGQGHIHQLLTQMSDLEFGGETDLVGCLKQFRPSRDRRGIVFLISDLFGTSPELATEALMQTTRWPAETHVIQVLHPNEKRPDFTGEIRLVDVETKETRRIWMTKREQERYTEAFEEFLEDVRTFCSARQVDHFPWTTAEPFEDTFLALLGRGAALASN